MLTRLSQTLQPKYTIMWEEYGAGTWFHLHAAPTAAVVLPLQQRLPSVTSYSMRK